MMAVELVNDGPVTLMLESPARLREQLESLAVARLDSGEMTAIERDHDLGPDPLGERDHAGVRTSEWEVGVVSTSSADTVEVIGRGAFDVKGTEARAGRPPPPALRAGRPTK